MPWDVSGMYASTVALNEGSPLAKGRTTVTAAPARSRGSEVPTAKATTCAQVTNDPLVRIARPAADDSVGVHHARN